MANQYINLYKDGQIISQGDGSNPLTVGPLNATENEVSAPIAVEVKCSAGFSTVGNTVLSFTGATATKWSICATETGSYVSTLTLTAPVTAAGITIYVKAKATEDEAPSNDVAVDISLTAVIQAV